MLDLIIVSGTNRDEANSPAIAAAYAQLAEDAGLTCEIIDLRKLPKDYLFSALYDNAGKHPEFNVLRDKMTNTPKFAFIVPEYNGSFPGVLKAFIDGLIFPDTFTGKKAALVGISSGLLGSSHAMSHLTDILNYCGTHVLARKPRLTRIEGSLENGTLVNGAYLLQLQKQIKELAQF